MGITALLNQQLEITRLPAKKESETLEFRETLRMKEEIGADASSFANASFSAIILRGATGALAKKQHAQSKQHKHPKNRISAQHT